MRILSIALCLAVLASACTQEPPVARYTVEEYRADKALRKEVFQRCANDPGTLGETPDCINARKAERLESRRPLRKSAPLGLNEKD